MPPSHHHSFEIFMRQHVRELGHRSLPITPLPVPHHLECPEPPWAPFFFSENYGRMQADALV